MQAVLTIRRVRFAWLMIWAVGCAGVLRAQAGSGVGTGLKIPAYEVVSIKPAADLLKYYGPGDESDGAHIIFTLKDLVGYAYGVRPGFVSCAIKWCDSLKFDIRAKVAGSDIADLQRLNSEQRAVMLKPVLAERFGVKVHTEARPVRVYELVVAKGGTKLLVRPPNAQAQNALAEGRPADGVIMLMGNEIKGFGVPIANLTKAFSDLFQNSIERPVIDKTGLRGTYDFDLKWTRKQLEDPSSDAVRDGGQPGDSGLSIFTAVQEQLGLKLQPATESMPVIVVDEAHLPSAN